MAAKKKPSSDFLGGELDPKEEKVLDWILNGIIIFVLAWLGLGILLSVRGLACTSWDVPPILCKGIDRSTSAQP